MGVAEVNGSTVDEVVNGNLPFDGLGLDGLILDAGLVGLIVSARHNLRYLGGGYDNCVYANDDRSAGDAEASGT